MPDLVVNVSRVIKAPIDKVFDAWTTPEQMKQWYSPEGMTTPAASSDNHPGGTYSVTMKMGDQVFDMTGTYLEFDRPNKLAYTWNHDDSVVTVTFKAIDDSNTEVNLHHTGFADEGSRRQHNEGWVGTLNKLTKFLL